ncbi:hypothetical protein BGZ46_009602 [Entomortierella lignicola]|nr:hypothetical protein BGZ46_009602 [Entomortierella lignicola]
MYVYYHITWIGALIILFVVLIIRARRRAAYAAALKNQTVVLTTATTATTVPMNPYPLAQPFPSTQPYAPLSQQDPNAGAYYSQPGTTPGVSGAPYYQPSQQPYATPKPYATPVPYATPAQQFPDPYYPPQQNPTTYQPSPQPYQAAPYSAPEGMFSPPPVYSSVGSIQPAPPVQQEYPALYAKAPETQSPLPTQGTPAGTSAAVRMPQGPQTAL